MKLDRLPAMRTYGTKWIVVDFRSGDDWNLLVQQIGELTNDATLRLPAQPQQNQVVPRKNRIDELRHNRFIVTNDAGKKFFTPLQLADQIRAQLIFD